MWLHAGGLRELIEQWWKSAPAREGNKAFIFFKKLQFVKSSLKEWNRMQFKDIFVEKFQMEKKLKELHGKVIKQEMEEVDFVEDKSLNFQ